MDPRTESMITDLRKHLTSTLCPLKREFGSRIKALWDKNLLPKARSVVKEWEERTTTVDWDNLEAWIEAAVTDFRRQLSEHHNLMTSLGIDASDTYPDPSKSVETALEKPKSSPLAQQLRRSYGPNWHANLEKLRRLETLPNSHDRNAKVEFRKSALDRAETVFSHWTTLRAMKEDGTLSSFGKEWDQLTPSQRIQRFQRHYPRLSGYPHAEIYRYIQSSESQRKSLEKGVFMTPLLDIEDLSRDNVLPKLLDIRATRHPGLFRTIDSRSVALGLFSEVLHLRVQGRIAFKSGAEYDRTNSYDISFEDEDDPTKLTSHFEVKAGIGILQLEAQCRTYDFLVSFPKNLSDSSEEIGQNFHHTNSDDCLPLLTRSSRSDYYGEPEIVDLEYLKVLLEASRNEALDDFWQLRMDSQSWVERWDETSAKSSGRVSNLLHAIFHRIDIFQSLSLHLDAVGRHVFVGAQMDGSTTLHPPDLLSLYSACQSSLDEMICQLPSTQWSPDKCAGSRVFSQLFDMIREKDPAVWVMGLPAVLRVMDREMRTVGTGEIQEAVMQTLNDISVLAACVRETWKHYVFESDVIEHISKMNELEALWEMRQRPWMSVLENTLQVMGQNRCHKLDVHIRKETNPQQRHRTFWTTIDKYMTSPCQEPKMSEVVDMIKQAAPIDTTPLAENAPVCTTLTHEATLAFSETKLRRSKYHKPQLAEQSPRAASTLKNPGSQATIVVKPEQDLELWARLLAPSSENDTMFHWTEFCKAMEGIGYRIIPQTGSVYRFEYDGSGASATSKQKLGTIIFHAPHGSGKVTHRQARTWWLKRILSRFEVEL